MTANDLHRGCKDQVFFCPKYRRKVLVPPIDDRIKALIIEKQDEYGCAVIEMEVLPDPVQLLLDVDPRIGINAVVRKIKGYTAHILRQEYAWMKSRQPSLWTRSRFLVSVGAEQYMEAQKGQ